MKLKNTRNNSGFTLVELLVVIAIIAGLAAISSPVIIRQLAKSRATTALSNGKDIYVGLRDFAFNNGGATSVGADANAAFNVVLASGSLQDEKPFFVKGTPPPAIQGNENSILAVDENTFSYFQAVTGAMGTGVNITNDTGNAPLIASPMLVAGNVITSTWENFYGDQAVVINSDGSGNVHPTGTATNVIIDPLTGAAYAVNVPGSVAANPWTGLAGGINADLIPAVLPLVAAP